MKKRGNIRHNDTCMLIQIANFAGTQFMKNMAHMQALWQYHIHTDDRCCKTSNFSYQYNSIVREIEVACKAK